MCVILRVIVHQVYTCTTYPWYDTFGTGGSIVLARVISYVSRYISCCAGAAPLYTRNLVRVVLTLAHRHIIHQRKRKNSSSSSINMHRDRIRSKRTRYVCTLVPAVLLALSQETGIIGPQARFLTGYHAGRKYNKRLDSDNKIKR